MIRATLILLVAYLLVPRLRRRSAAERHLFWAVSLLTASVVPALTVLLPPWRPEWGARLGELWTATILSPWSSREGVEVVVRATGIEPAAWTPGQWLILLWAAGTIGVLLVLAGEVVKLARLLSSATHVSDARLRRVMREVSGALELRQQPVLLHSPRASMPITWGVRHPRVLLPSAAADWPDERLRAVLTHELAHVRRGDWLVHMLAQVACAIYWFHPLFWAAERQLARESEQAADDEVLRLGIEGSAFAAHLVEIVRMSRAQLSRRAPIVAMAGSSHLERRVAALLSPSVNRRSATGPIVFAATAVGLVAAFPLAAMATRASFDVGIRTLDLPVLVLASNGTGVEPRLPDVRMHATPGEGARVGVPVVLPAITDYTTPPLYSEQALRRGVEGVVTISARIDGGGRLTRAHVVKGLGSGLDQNALVALRQWRFEAGTRGGRPAVMDVEVDVEFSLRSEAVNALIANDMATLVGPGVTPPRVVRRAAAPEVVARGSVVLDVVLLEDGSPKIVRILRSLSPEADESAVRHFEQWRFTPATKGGVPVKVRMNAEVRFHG